MEVYLVITHYYGGGEILTTVKKAFSSFDKAKEYIDSAPTEDDYCDISYDIRSIKVE